MAKIRVNRIAEQIKKELGELIQLHVKDPRIGFVTVTGVELTNDVSLAKVYISVFGDEEKKKVAFQVLEKAQGFLRTEVGKRMRLRHVPELQFKCDSSIEYSSRIEELLHKIHKEEPKDGK